MIELANQFLMFIGLWFVVITFHELGHVSMLLWFNRDPKLKWEGLNPTFSIGSLKSYKKFLVLLGGVILGFLVLIFFTYNIDLYYFLLYTGFYIIGSWNDIEEMAGILYK